MTVADHRFPEALGAPSVGVGFKPGAFRRRSTIRVPNLGFSKSMRKTTWAGSGAPHRRLDAIRERYQLSLHGVGLSIGSSRPGRSIAPIFDGSRQSRSASRPTLVSRAPCVVDA